MAKKNSFPYIFVVVVILALVYFLVGSPDSLTDSARTDTADLPALEALELPAADLPAEIIQHAGYVVSYNPTLRIPNWVAYELTAEETNGEAERTDEFLPDPLVKGDPVLTSDYTRSGYDRGHMAPAADMRWSDQAMQESFYMTNMCPQNHNLNKGDWNDLEIKVRSWARYFGHVYVCCGPIVEPGYATIGTYRKIAVPQAFFKVILAEKNGHYEAIGFIMPNEAGHRQLSAYAFSIDEVESRTGLDFFPALPDDCENTLEASYALAPWRLK